MASKVKKHGKTLLILFPLILIAIVLLDQSARQLSQARACYDTYNLQMKIVLDRNKAGMTNNHELCSEGGILLSHLNQCINGINRGNFLTLLLKIDSPLKEYLAVHNQSCIDFPETVVGQ